MIFFFSPLIVAGSFLKLTKLNFWFSALNEDETIQLFTRMARDKVFNLKSLNFGKHPSQDSHISAVEPGVFAQAVCKLQEVNLTSNKITREQLKTLFQSIILKQSNLEVIELSFDESEMDGKRREAFSMMKGLFAEALKTVKDVTFEDLPSDYFDHFIDVARKDPDFKTRYITTSFGINKHQKELENALSENPNLQFSPHHRTHPKMIGWTDSFDYDEDNDDDVDHGDSLDDEYEDDYDEDTMIDLYNQMMMMQMNMDFELNPDDFPPLM